MTRVWHCLKYCSLIQTSFSGLLRKAHFEVVKLTKRKNLIERLGVLRYRSLTLRIGKFNIGLLISSFKHHYFGSAAVRLTKKRCEAFFDDPSNFVRTPIR